MYYDKYLGSYSSVNTDKELDLNMKNRIRKVEKIVDEYLDVLGLTDDEITAPRDRRVS